MAAADGVREDPEIYPIMVDLAGCISAEFARSGLGDTEPNLAVGDTYTLEIKDCDEPDTWIRLVNAYPSIGVPIASQSPLVTDMGFLLEVGSSRCFPDPGPNGTYDASDYLAAARLQLADMSALKRAICACLQAPDENHRRMWAFTDYQPGGPQGAAIWGSWQINIGTVLQ